MALIRLQDNTPQIYTEKSRDFQLLCRAYDSIINGIKFDIDTIVDIIDTKRCSSRLLPLLQTKLGFFTNNDITDEDMRYALLAFPEIIKNKGSLKAIKQALNMFLKLSHIKTGVYISIINKTSIVNEETYSIRIGIESDLKDVTILNEIFKYILPTGYKIQYFFYITPQAFVNYLSQEDINIAYISDVINAQVKTENEVIGNNLFKNIVHTELTEEESVTFISNGNTYSNISTSGTVGDNTLNIYYGETKVYDTITNESVEFDLSAHIYQLDQIPVVPGSLKISNTDGFCCDDGHGNLMGTLFSSVKSYQGTINYVTGEITLEDDVEFSNIPALFQYQKGGWLDPQYKYIDFGITPQQISNELYIWIQENTHGAIMNLMGTVSLTEVVGNIADTTPTINNEIQINSGTQVIGYVSSDKKYFYQDSDYEIQIIPYQDSVSFIYIDLGTGTAYRYNTSAQKFIFATDGPQIVGYIDDNLDKFYSNPAKTEQIIPVQNGRVAIYIDLITKDAYIYNFEDEIFVPATMSPIQATYNGG